MKWTGQASYVGQHPRYFSERCSLEPIAWVLAWSWASALFLSWSLVVGLLGVLFLSPLASAAEPPDLVRLRNVICHQIESSAEAAHPEWMRGDGSRGGNPQSWGLCQIQYRTAVGIGGLKWLERAGGFPAVFTVLGDADKAKDVALTILRWCAGVKGRRTVIGLAACYNSPSALYPKNGPLRDYSEKVSTAYYAKK